MTIKHSSPAAQSARGAASSPRNAERARALINFEFALSDTPAALSELARRNLIDYDNGGIHLYATEQNEKQGTQVRAVAATWSDYATYRAWILWLQHFQQDCAALADPALQNFSFIPACMNASDCAKEYGQASREHFKDFADAAAYGQTSPELRK